MKGSWFQRAPRAGDGPERLEDAAQTKARHVEEHIRARYAERLQAAGRKDRKVLQAEMEAEIRRDVAALSSEKPSPITLF